ncbi:MAG: ABC transporter ATP-binding protein [Pirellulaceae bacterium]
MAQLSTSRQRFQAFLGKFRRREVGLDDHEKAQLAEKSRRSDNGRDHSKDDDKQTKKRRRRRYLRLYLRELRPYWGSVSLLIVLSIVIAGLDLVQPLFYREIVDGILLNAELDNASRFGQLHTLGIVALLIVVVSQVLGIFKNYRQYLLNVKVILNLRRNLFDRLIRLPLENLSTMKTGGIISRLTDDVNTTTGLFEMAIVSPVVAGLRLLISIGILFYLNWQLALTAISVIPIVMGISFLASRRIRPIYRQVRDDVSLVDGRVGEAFSGIRAVRAFQGELREEHEYTVGHNTITRMKLFARKKELVLWSSWGFLMASIGLVIFWVGGYLYIQGRATIGDITAFQVYTFMLLSPVWQIVNSFSELQRSLAAMERVFEVLETPEDKPDSPSAVLAPSVVEQIEFRNVWFAYENENFVLRDFNLVVPGGSVIALVGKSGAGKTTVTDLIARFNDPNRGQILLNDMDLKQIRLDSFRKLLGVVQQDVFLFDGTVRENIAYADRTATLDDVIDAARRANAHEFIEKLPLGYETVIGERGVKLSGGQRQRMSIARALLADPQILILDEATSNLDTESEQLIQGSIEELLKHRTTFMIAHRLSTIAHADQIVVLDQGQIVETGTHDELLAKSGLYSQMVNRQNAATMLE